MSPYKKNYEAIKKLPAKARKKAFEIAHALSEENIHHDIIVPISISGAKYWAANYRSKR